MSVISTDFITPRLSTRTKLINCKIAKSPLVDYDVATKKYADDNAGAATGPAITTASIDAVEDDNVGTVFPIRFMQVTTNSHTYAYFDPVTFTLTVDISEKMVFTDAIPELYKMVPPWVNFCLAPCFIESTEGGLQETFVQIVDKTISIVLKNANTHFVVGREYSFLGCDISYASA